MAKSLFPGVSTRFSLAWVGAAALGIVAVAITGCGGQQHSPAPSTPTTSRAPALPPDRLDSILPTVADVNSVMGVSDLQPGAPISHTTFNSAITLSRPDCLGAFLAGQTSIYRDSGYSAVSYEFLREPGPAFVQLTAVSFASADPARKFLNTSLGKWRSCAGQTITDTLNGKTDSWTFGNLGGNAPAITLVRTQVGAHGYACQHALSAVSNVVLDVSTCDTPINGQAAKIVDKMTAAVNQQVH